jgi:hypothetical protein
MARLNMCNIDLLAPQQPGDVPHIAQRANDRLIARARRLQDRHLAELKVFEKLSGAAAQVIIIARDKDVRLIAIPIKVAQHVLLKNLHPTKHVRVMDVDDTARVPTL